MNRFLYSLTIFIVLYCFSPLASSKELIKEFKGSESRTTAEFEVKAPWVVDWMTTGDYPGTMAMDVHLVTSPGGQYVGKVVMTKWIDNGVKLFDESGTYRLKVDSNLINWTLRVEQLTRQEAETYIPKDKIKD
jgi:hypothetical protein